MAFKRKPVFRRGLFRMPLQADTRLADRFKAYLSIQQDSLKQSFGRIWQTPVASSLTILVFGRDTILPKLINLRHKLNSRLFNKRSEVQAKLKRCIKSLLEGFKT